MPIGPRGRPVAEEEFVVGGSADAWLTHSQRALQAAGFKGVQTDSSTRQIKAKWRSLTIVGDIVVTLFPDREGVTRIRVRSSVSQKDHYRNVRGQLLDKFKAALPSVPPAPVQQRTSAGSLSHELERIGKLRDSGVLTEEEFAAAKAKLLSGPPA